MKDNLLTSLEKSLRSGWLYEAFEYVGDSISTQDLVLAEQDKYYLDYLVDCILDEVKNWDVDSIKDMIDEVGGVHESKVFLID